MQSAAANPRASNVDDACAVWIIQALDNVLERHSAIVACLERRTSRPQRTAPANSEIRSTSVSGLNRRAAIVTPAVTLSARGAKVVVATLAATSHRSAAIITTSNSERRAPFPPP
jgi:hypothetical protein